MIIILNARKLSQPSDFQNSWKVYFNLTAYLKNLKLKSPSKRTHSVIKRRVLIHPSKV